MNKFLPACELFLAYSLTLFRYKQNSHTHSGAGNKGTVSLYCQESDYHADYKTYSNTTMITSIAGAKN